MRSIRLALAALVLAQPLSAAFAADWQLVLSDRSRKVEIDRGSIFASDGGTKVSWGRVVLSPAEAGRAGYSVIKALNRYDCANRSFVTVKRVYLDASANVVREESVADQTPVVVTRNSVDERMWREVCNPPTSTADVDKVASQIASLAAASSTAAAPPPAAAQPQRAQTPPATPAAPEASPPTPPPASILPPLPSLAAAAKAAEPAPASAPVPPPAPAPVAAAKPAPAARAASAPENAVDPIRRAVAQTARRTEPPPPTRREARPPAPRPTATPRAAARPAANRPPAPRPPAASDWSYEGASGPQNWGSLRPEWRLCSSGTRQSPIDLREGVGVELTPVRFDYRPSAFRVRDTGKTVQVDVVENMGIEVRGTRYALERFTLHRPSMDRIDGRAEDMAVYFEHRSATGEVAILSVQLSASAEADPNPALQAVWNNLPLDRGRDFLPTAAIDLAAFVPAATGHYLYQGSLPTPPCTEDVLWVVMKQPVAISPEQLAVFARLYPRSGRPIQPANGRLILESS